MEWEDFVESLEAMKFKACFERVEEVIRVNKGEETEIKVKDLMARKRIDKYVVPILEAQSLEELKKLRESDEFVEIKHEVWETLYREIEVPKETKPTGEYVRTILREYTVCPQLGEQVEKIIEMLMKWKERELKKTLRHE